MPATYNHQHLVIQHSNGSVRIRDGGSSESGSGSGITGVSLKLRGDAIVGSGYKCRTQIFKRHTMIASSHYYYSSSSGERKKGN